MWIEKLFVHLQITKAKAYENQGNLVKALEIFKQIQLYYDEIESADTFVLRRMASIWEELGNEKNALIFYKQILKFNSDDREILVKVVRLLKKSHKIDELFSYLERIHLLWPDNNNFTIEYGNALMEKNQYPQASAVYSEIVELYDETSDKNDDDVKIASLKIGECLLKMGDAKAAYKMFRELVKYDNKFK